MFRSLCMCEKENDREIDEWYNEENKAGKLEVVEEVSLEL